MRNNYLLFTLLLLSTRLEAQLPVSRERHHTVILENQYLRLLEGRIPMHDTTPAHIHAANSVVIFLSHSTFGIQVVGDEPVITTVNPGDLKYVAYGDKPVNHLVWNQTPPLFHFFVVELAKHPPAGDSCPILTRPGITLRWRQPSVNAYSVDITDTRPLHLTPAPCARLLVAITGTLSAGSIPPSPNEYRFFAPKTPIDLKGAAQCILLEIY
jgi:hypothetical protein